MGKYVLNVEGGSAFCVDFFSAWYKDRGLRAVVIGDGENGVVSLRLREFSDEI
jgi:hypothetical protein